MSIANEPAPIDVAVLDARERAALVSARALGRTGLRVGAFAAEPAPAFSSRWVKVAGMVADYSRDAGTYVDSVLETVDRYRPKVVIPVHDGSIEALRTRRSELSRVTTLALAAEPQLEVAMDKSRTFDVARSLGIDMPRMAAVDGHADPAALAGEIGLPAVVKPMRSWVIGSDHRLTSVLATSLAELEAALAAVRRNGVPAVVQEWVPGRREAIWLFNARGRIWARFAQVAYRTHPPLGGMSVIRESIAPPRDIAEAADALVGEIGLEGFSEVEFRRDAAGRPLLMEINPRLSASVELARCCGVDFPELIYAWCTDRPLTTAFDYQPGVRIRWLGGDIRWLHAMLRGGGGPDSMSAPRAVAQFTASFLRPHRYDYASLSDPLPAVRASADFVLRGLGVRPRATAMSSETALP